VTEPPQTSPSQAPTPSAAELQMLTALVQHKLNNPLAALLAEVQLLGMEDTLDAQHRASVERITGLVRRVIGIVRDLDVAVEAKLLGR
jgi:light-regulated signal transduction histidine kinase (bacteriophytochrome)